MTDKPAIQTVNLGKLIGLIIIAVAILIGLMLERLDPTPGWAALTLIVGYLVGNGVAAKRGDPVDPALGSRYDGR